MLSTLRLQDGEESKGKDKRPVSDCRWTNAIKSTIKWPMLICVSKFNNLKLNYILRARVCGDRAIAHMHYGGICCYSCKVSFTTKEEESPSEVTCWELWQYNCAM